MRYRASLDTTAKLLTSAVILLMLFILYRNFFAVQISLAIKLVVVVGFWIILFLSWAFSTSAYEVDSENIIIHRQYGKVVIPLSNVKSVRTVNKKELGTLIRTWGSGGLFGYYGNFRSTRMGKLKLYTTQRKNLVLVTTLDEDHILLSPDDLTMVQKIESGIS